MQVVLFKSGAAITGFFKSKRQYAVPITLKNYSYRGNWAVDAINAANFKVGDNMNLTIQEVHSKK